MLSRRVLGGWLFVVSLRLFVALVIFQANVVAFRVETANAAAKAKGSYLRDKFYRLKARRGFKRAAVATAHKILVAIYHMLSQRVCYNDLRDPELPKRV